MKLWRRGAIALSAALGCLASACAGHADTRSTAALPSCTSVSELHQGDYCRVARGTSVDVNNTVRMVGEDAHPVTLAVDARCVFQSASSDVVRCSTLDAVIAPYGTLPVGTTFDFLI